jgi:hypothetical protein
VQPERVTAGGCTITGIVTEPFGIFHRKVELDAVTINVTITGAVKIEGRGRVVEASKRKQRKYF